MSHPYQMRQMLHTHAKRFIWTAFAGSIAATVGLYVFYVHPRHLKYEEYFKNYDGYARFKEICSSGNQKILHTCPKELHAIWTEKGKPVAPLQ